MSTQYLLLANDGDNRIIEAEELKDELVVPPTLSSPSENKADSDVGHRVAVKKHYCNGNYYAVALDRHAASNEIDDIIDSLQPAPIDPLAS